MPQNDDSGSDTLDIEIDNFVSPDAQADVPADDFVELEIDPPVALANDEDDEDDARLARSIERARLFDAARPEDMERYLARNRTFVCDECLPGRPCYRESGAIVPATWMPGDPIPTQANETTNETTIEHATSGDGGTLEGALATIASNAPITGNTSGSLADGTMAYVGFTSATGYVTALQNGVKQATADGYLRTLRTVYHYTNEQISALTITIIPEGTDRQVSQNPTVVTADGPSVFERRRIALGLPLNARLTREQTLVADRIMRGEITLTEAQALLVPPTQATPVVAPQVDRGIMPREQILRDLVDQSPGVCITMSRAERRSTHVKLPDVRTALEAVGMGDLAPRRKTEKRQFGEVMRSLNTSETRAWFVTRRDMARTETEWPTDLVARWCVGTLDGSDSLGSLGEKVLIADLLDNGEIRFTGGSDMLRARVEDAFATRCGEMLLNATDLLTWFRDRVLPEHFHALDCAGAIYVPGDSTRLDTLVNAIRPIMSRRITLWDVVSGASLTGSLIQGLDQMLDEIAADYATDVEKAQDRERNKIKKQRSEYTDADLDLAARRAVVLPERAGTYLRRLNDAQAYLDGLKKLLGDDTEAVKARLAALRTTIEPLCDATSAMGAAIEMD